MSKEAERKSATSILQGDKDVNTVIRLFVAPKGGGRENNVNVIRFVAAAMVIYGHMSHLGGYQMPTIIGNEVSSVAVKIFFVLSGYLITKSFMRDDNLFRYGVRRVFRIFPGLISLVLVTVFIIGPLLTTETVEAYFTNSGTYGYLMNAALLPVYTLPGVFADNLYPNAVNGSLWTLPVEFFMYLLLPLVIILFRRMKILKLGLVFAAVASIVIEIVVLAYFPEERLIVWGTNIFDGFVLQPYFFVGAMLSLPEFKRLFHLQAAFAVFFVSLILIFSHYWMYELLLVLTLPYITLSFALATPAIFGRVFAIHDYSYGLYLWGFITQQTLLSILGTGALGFLPFTAISLLFALGCAMISWHFVESPFNKIGKRITRWSLERNSIAVSKVDV